MALADFIAANTEAIISEWVVFAATCGPADTMDRTELRDHALEMLQSIVADLRTPQTDAEQVAKSKGQADLSTAVEDTAAEVHGADRAESGFTIGEMVSEYRALRASVIRLWTRSEGTLTGDDLQDLMRFNEAIDQALAESVSRYSTDIDRSKEMFLAILGHDLRTPIGAVITSSQFMLDTGELAEPHRSLTTRIVTSARRMNGMVGDLLDFTRSQLGAGVPIVRAPMDLGRQVELAVEEMTSAQYDCSIAVETEGDVTGNWDAGRLHQVVANLLGNAVHHGSAKTPITATVRGEGDEVTLRVHNRGPAIADADLEGLFSPFKRLKKGAAVGTATANLGLGLYIVQQIVIAHGGRVEVSSSDGDGTAFTVRLPRTEP